MFSVLTKWLRCRSCIISRDVDSLKETIVFTLPNRCILALAFWCVCTLMFLGLLSSSILFRRVFDIKYQVDTNRRYIEHLRIKYDRLCTSYKQMGVLLDNVQSSLLRLNEIVKRPLMYDEILVGMGYRLVNNVYFSDANYISDIIPGYMVHKTVDRKSMVSFFKHDKYIIVHRSHCPNRACVGSTATMLTDKDNVTLELWVNYSCTHNLIID